MSQRLRKLADALAERFGNDLDDCRVAFGEVTIEVTAANLVAVATALRDEEPFRFEQLTDLCGVDYLSYGGDEWTRGELSTSGFSRGVEGAGTTGRLHFGDEAEGVELSHPRFAAVTHLLSLSHNQRLRIRCYAPDDEAPLLPTLVDVWPSANWFEREAFDLFGILFEGHPDLRRILTDYGFVGHPFRKDFPLVGNVEVRYDPEKARVIYQPVTIEPRVLVPKIIREDNRYAHVKIEREDDPAVHPGKQG
ncbi:MAG: NADH-quinone oxidoreductase subunit C [Halofilum sp. (in: g-proteobacteria)]|nr:NADH-quinone oxidoreductase subunit C [Halofilum sp. (in: g-proteobacteria)]